MKNKFEFRIANKENKLRYTATVDIELKDDNGPQFSASASVGNGHRWIMGGQCLDSIVKDFNFVKRSDRVTFMQIFDLWKKHHLNGLNAGTQKQEDALKEGFDAYVESQGIKVSNSNRYTLQCEFLKSINLYKDPDHLVEKYDKEMVPYIYGTGWIYRSIPQNDLDLILALLEK